MKRIEGKLNEYAAVAGFQCPAEFWSALGYTGEQRYVGIYWERAGDEACFSDGRTALCGADWPAYQALIEHNFPLGHPARWLLGTSETLAAFWLVIDRVTEWGWLCPADEAEALLQLQWPVEETTAGAGAISFEEWLEGVTAALDAARARAREMSMEDIVRQMDEQARHRTAFLRALALRRPMHQEGLY